MQKKYFFCPSGADFRFLAQNGQKSAKNRKFAITRPFLEVIDYFQKEGDPKDMIYRYKSQNIHI